MSHELHARKILDKYDEYRMDAAATINFSVQSGAATIRERCLLESGVYFVQSGYRNSSQL